MQPQTFIFFGTVGSGKGTQAKLLAGVLKKNTGKDSVYAGTGEGFRSLVEGKGYTGELVKDSMHRGELQPNFLTTAIFTNILISAMTPEIHLIADGYPRNVEQSESLDAMMKFYKRNDVKIIFIDLPEEEAKKRMLLRARVDDTEEGIAKRLNEFKNKVIPSMNYFKDKTGYTIFTINGAQTVENVQKDINKVLGL